LPPAKAKLDGANGYWDRSAIMFQGGPYHALAYFGNRGPVLYTLSVRRGVTFILNGTNDTLVDITDHELGEKLLRLSYIGQPSM
jgi:hypothetical protein